VHFVRLRDNGRHLGRRDRERRVTGLDGWQTFLALLCTSCVFVAVVGITAVAITKDEIDAAGGTP
jgi:hypothetical protein